MAKKATAARDDSSSLDPDVRLARKWKKEIDLAGKREKDWRLEADKILKRYKGESKKRNSFNILWANTEILRPAIYNSLPSPDVRRRFRDADPIGKAVSEVLERGLNVVVDQDSTDESLKADTLDSLIQGRGISRVRYVPSITGAADEGESDGDADASAAADGPADVDKSGSYSAASQKTSGSSQTVSAQDAARSIGGDGDDNDEDAESLADEELEFEQALIEHVDWRDFRHGYGRTWPEVPWVGFRCKMTKGEGEQKFGEGALDGVNFADAPVEDDKDKVLADSEVRKTAEFWEVWDKPTKRVFFVCEGAKKCLYPKDNPKGEPPLKFTNFFPCPQPLRIVEDSTSTIPTPIFRLYEEQALELDNLSRRINLITNKLKLRGVYDSTLDELNNLMNGDDGDLIPIAKAQVWAQNGGLDKAISWLPIDMAAAVLAELIKARDACKAIIYELTGISDIIRGASMASETATAQQIKANYASVRLQRMQKLVQDYARDLLRLCAEVISSEFSQSTLEKMTGLSFPTPQQKQQAQMALQPPPQQAMLPPAAPPGGQAPMPPPGQGAQSPPPGAPPSAPPGGQPPGPPQPPPQPDPQAQLVLSMPTWDEIMQVMHDSGLRMYKIDVETDSTVAGSLSSDMQGLAQVIQSIGQMLSLVTPLVQQGVLPLEAAKEMVMAVVRRAKMGLAVEDQLEKMKAPPPPPPQQQPQDNSLQVAQLKAQTDQAMQAAKHQHEQAMAQAKEQAETQRAKMEAMGDALIAKNQAMLDAAVKVIVAQIMATKAPSTVTPIAEREFAASVIPTQSAAYREQHGLSPALQPGEMHHPAIASIPGHPTQPIGPAAMPQVDPNAPPPGSEPPPDQGGA